MLFNSYSFFVFFAAVLILSRMIGSWRMRKGFLLIVSYFFYAAWNPPFVILLWISTIIDWILGKKIFNTQNQTKRRIFLWLSLAANLGLLGYFKYGGFILENFIAALNSIGIPYHPAMPSIILPVGISFYTFQTLSYTFDIYKRNTKPWHSFLDYALYVTFFPQLVAGPIVRAVDFLPQCSEPKKGNANQIGWGLSLFIIGLFNKIVIADQFMAPIVEKVFDKIIHPSFFQAWAGTLAFAIQIFCDFAGYSSCAIGIALCLGFALPDNFRYPYAAVGFSDFWKRWHISLSSWLKDYLYIMLGGNRKGSLRTYANLMITMLLGGLWHGASWLFVIWGGLHGLFLMAERWLKKLKIASLKIWRTAAGETLLSLMTFACVTLAWTFFRAKTLPQALTLARSMLGLNLNAPDDALSLGKFDFTITAAVLLIMLLLHRILRNSSLEEKITCLPWWTRSIALSVMICAITLSFTGGDRAFIYFQF